jgi:hypothetical protein
MFVAEKNLQGANNTELTFIQARNTMQGTRPEDELPRLLKPNPEPELLPGEVGFHCGGQEFGVWHGQKGCLRIHRSPVEPYRRALKRCFFEPTEAIIRLYNRLNGATGKLVEEWWEKIETSRKFSENEHKISAYHRALRPGSITLVGLIAEVGQGMVTANNGRFLGYLDGTPQAHAIRQRQEQLARNWRKHRRVGHVFEKLLDEHNGDFEATVERLKDKFHEKNDLGLQRGEIYRVVPRESVAREEDFAKAFEFRKAELEELWANSSTVKEIHGRLRSEHGRDFARIFEGLDAEVKSGALSVADLGVRKGESYAEEKSARRLAVIYSGLIGVRSWVPYRKGDPKGSRWSTTEPLFIDWSRPNVRWLWEHSGGEEAKMPVLRNADVFFTDGITWTRHGNHVGLKARLQPPCVFDTNGSRLTPIGSAISTNQLLAILNADLFSHIIKKFVKNTQDYEINDLRMAPIVVPTVSQAEELESLAKLAIEAKELSLKQVEPTVALVRECQNLSERQKAAPAYLHPDPQMVLLHASDDCLAVVELAVNWAVERLYQVEGLGPFNEF